MEQEPLVHCLYDRMVGITDLVPHPKNCNKHPEDQVIRLAKILKYQGWRSPIKVSKRSGFVTAGHGRIEAARFNDWSTVPVNFQDYDSEEKEYADIQADNAIASWAILDVSTINIDLSELGPDFDLDMLGLRNFEIDPPIFSTDETNEEEKETTRRGMECPSCGYSFGNKKGD